MTGTVRAVAPFTIKTFPLDTGEYIIIRPLYRQQLKMAPVTYRIADEPELRRVCLAESAGRLLERGGCFWTPFDAHSAEFVRLARAVEFLIGFADEQLVRRMLSLERHWKGEILAHLFDAIAAVGLEKASAVIGDEWSPEPGSPQLHVYPRETLSGRRPAQVPEFGTPEYLLAVQDDCKRQRA